MLSIRLNQAAKRFHLEWIFKDLDLDLKSGDHIAITGSNGSGKSTLLKCLSGILPLTSGKLEYSLQNKPLTEGDYFSQLSISTPYLELPEEFTLEELLTFHFKFKKPAQNLSKSEMMELMYLEKSKNKSISNFSSGMKQRLKLGLCFFADSPLILLDEPTSNLDQRGVDWYLDMIRQYGGEKIMVICSNDPREYGFCNKTISMEDYKGKIRL